MVVTILKYVALAIVVYYAVVGAVFIHSTKPIGAKTEHCPRIVRYEDDTLACIIDITDDTKPITIMRGE